MKKIKLWISDIDGTLMNYDGSVTSTDDLFLSAFRYIALTCSTAASYRAISALFIVIVVVPSGFFTPLKRTPSLSSCFAILSA